MTAALRGGGDPQGTRSLHGAGALHDDTALRTSAARQTIALTQRSLIGRIRQPAVLAPAFIFPLFFAALSASTFSRVANAPNFPEVDSFLQFGLAACILQGVLFGATSGATDVATDIELGFWDRLVASPVARTSIVVGRLGSAVAVAAVQALVFTAVLWPFGAHVDSGVPGVIALAVSAALTGLALSSFLAAFAIRSGSAEVVQAAFPLVFMLMFLSSAFMPREMMSGWYLQVVELNPVTYLVEGMREIVLESSVSADALLKAWGIPALASVVAVWFCLRAQRRRLASV